MAKVLVLYYSATGNTKRMAEEVARAVESKGLETKLASVEGLKAKEMISADGIIIGSPTYYGSMAAGVKRLLDESVEFHGKLDGKVGGAFSSSANVGGGNETTVLDILKAMLIHGMIVKGSARGDHYGPVAIGAPDDRALKECRELGESVAELVLKLQRK